jgi:ribosomal-protein-alanine N-acetyltransferase
MTPAALAALHARCFETPRPWSAAEFAALLGQPGVLLETAAAGFALGRVASDEAELLTLAVDPTRRRGGHGRALLAAFEAAARARGAARVFLEVAETNAPARALYAAAGYAEAGRRRGYYRAPGGAAADAIVLARRLGPDATGRGAAG